MPEVSEKSPFPADKSSQSWNLYRRTARRFSPRLYHKAKSSPAVLFFVGMKSLLFELIKVLYGSLRASRVPIDVVSVFATGNQAKALGRAYELQLISAKPRAIYSVDLRLNLALLCTGIAALIRFPYFFAKASYLKRRLLHERLLHSGRMKAIRRFLERRKPSRLAISNDHQGLVFHLATLASWSGVKVQYVQHGAVQKEFPPNNFSELYLWDKRSVEIYQKLARRAVLHLVPELTERSTGGQAGGALSQPPTPGVLICLSHQFPVIKLFTACWQLRSVALPVTVRFHPSDRLARLKIAVLKIANKRCRRDSYYHNFREAYRYSNVALIASSSILLDAVEMDPSRAIWVKPFGLQWDYYKLSEKLQVAESVPAAMAILEKLLSNNASKN